MGEVYRARDTKLGREVAIKVLPAAFSEDAERLARFEREARLLASLNHPNIATLHGLEQSGNLRFLVMELVPGETLAERIKQSAIPVEEALPLFMQIAEALEAAHEKDVIHRDLKPANIKLTPDEKVKVLDFGLAKATEGTPSGDSSESPTVTGAATEAGVILGTAGYMSPEQARGKTVDKRTDIWAFGCCLYEALTAQVTFQGDTLSDTLASVLGQDPDWEALPERTPRTIRRLLERCLQKDPRRRFRDAWDVRVELEEALGEPAVAPSEAMAPPTDLRWRRTAPWLAAGALALLATSVGMWGWLRAGPPPPGTVTRLRLATPPLPGAHGRVAVSPDGSRLALVGQVDGTSQIFLRSMDRLDTKPLEGTDSGRYPFFSPDGQWIGFIADAKLKKVSVAGGAPVTLCDAPKTYGATWGSDGRIYFRSVSGGPGILSVSAAGGQPQTVTTPEEGSHWPRALLPGGKALLIAMWPPRSSILAEDSTIGVVALDTGKFRPLIERTASAATYSASGHLIFPRGGSLLAVPFDVERLEITGEPVPVLEGFMGRFPDFKISDNGTLVYVPGSGEPGNRLVWVDRTGETQPVTEERGGYFAPRISPDGRRIAVGIEKDGSTDVWIYDLTRGTMTRLTTAPGADAVPVWTADGRRVAFQSNRDGRKNLYWKPADGSGPTERLTESDDGQWPYAWSPDGRVLAFAKASGNRGDVWILPMEGERKPVPFLETPFDEWAAHFSPDGRWIAYLSNESGRLEVYVLPYPGPGPRHQISTNGGFDPLWARDGKEIFYRTDDDQMMVVPVRLEPEFKAGKPKVLFEGRFQSKVREVLHYDITPDGERFVMVESEEESAPTEIIVVLNWFEELKRLVPTAD